MGETTVTSFPADIRPEGSGSDTYRFDFLHREDKSVFAVVCISYHENGFWDNGLPTPYEKITASIDCSQLKMFPPNKVQWNSRSLFYIKIPIYNSEYKIEPCLLKPDEYKAPENLSLLIHATVKHFLHLVGILETLNYWDHSVVEKWTKHFKKNGYEVPPPPEYSLTVTSSRSWYDPRTFVITANPQSEDVSVDGKTVKLSGLKSVLEEKLQLIVGLPNLKFFSQQFIEIDKRLDVLLLHSELYSQ